MRKYLLSLFVCLAVCSTARGQTTPVTTLTASGTSCVSPTAGSVLIVAVGPNYGSASFTINANAGGNTITFYASGDGGKTYSTLSVTPSNSTTTVTSTSTTTAGTVFRAAVSGYTHVCMLMSTQASGNTNVVIYPAFPAASIGGGGGGLAPNSPGIPSANGNVYYATNYGAAFNALNLLSCSGSGTSLTCTGTGTNFIATDVGKTVWASASGSNQTADLPPTAITAVNSTTNVSVTGPYTRTLTSGEAVYGTDDTTAINSIPYEGPLNCNTSMHFPAGGTIISAAILNTNVPARCAYDQTTNTPTISGEGTGATILYASPSFTFGTLANCTSIGGYCIGAGDMNKRDFTVSSGLGASVKSANSYNGCFMGLASPASIQNVTLYEYSINGNAQAVCVPSGSAWLLNDQFFGFTGNTNNAACTDIAASGAAVTLFNVYVVSACAETPGAAMQLSGTVYADFVYGQTAQPNAILVSGNFSWLESITAGLGITVSGASTFAWIHDSYQQEGGGDTCRLNITTGAKVYAQASLFNNTTGSGTHYGVCIDATSTLVDLGGNTFSGFTAPANITSGGMWTAFGGPSGTININAQLGGASACVSSQTLFLFPYGQTATDACNSATAETQIGGFVAPRAGTLYNLSFSATTGGVATDAATIYQNGSASAITCTYGTGTSCTDVTHTVSVAAGDTIGCAIVTHATDTTVKPVCSVVLF